MGIERLSVEWKKSQATVSSTYTRMISSVSDLFRYIVEPYKLFENKQLKILAIIALKNAEFSALCDAIDERDGKAN